MRASHIVISQACWPTKLSKHDVKRPEGMYNVQMFAFLLVVFAILLLGAYAKYKYERWMRGPAPRLGGGSRSAFSSQTTTPNKGPPIEWSEDWSDDDDDDDDFGPVHKIV